MKFLKADNLTYECLFLTFYILPMWLSLSFLDFLTKVIYVSLFFNLLRNSSYDVPSLSNPICTPSLVPFKAKRNIRSFFIFLYLNKKSYEIPISYKYY